MATDVERLIVRLEVSQARFERQMANMSNVANRRAKQVESRFAAMNRNIQSQFSGLGARLTGVLAGALTVQSATRFIDSSVRIQNALRVSGLEGAELTKVYDALFESAQKNAAPFETLVTLYSRTALVQRELGVTTQELTGFTDTIAMALRAGGTSAQEASGALLQLSQALGSGVVRAEEFNSINEGAPTILQAAAAGIEEAGGSVATLRQLMIDGKLSSQAFFRGIEAGAPLIEQRLDGATSTISQSFQRLDNAFTDLARRFNESSEATGTFAAAVDTMVATINSVDVSHIVSEIERIIAAVQGAKAAIDFLVNTLPALGANIGEWTGLDNVGRFVDSIPGASTLGITSTANDRDEQDGIQARFDGLVDQTNEGFDAFAEAWRSRQAEAAAVQNVPAPTARPASEKDIAGANITPISLADFAVPGDGEKRGSKGGKAGRKGGKGGGGGSRGEDKAFEREAEQIRERTAAIQAETAAMAALNPTIEDYNFTLEKTRAEQDLLNAAKKAGIGITPQLREQIATLATGYATASAEANKLADSQDDMRRQAEEFSALQKDIVGGFVSDLRSGTSAAEALSNSLGKIADKLIEIGLNSLLDSKGSGGLGSGIASVIGGLFGKKGFASGTANTGGRRGQPRGVVHGQEAVIPLPAGGKVPVDVRLPAQSGGRQSTSITYQIDARGSQMSEAQFRSILAENNKRVLRDVRSGIGAMGDDYQMRGA